ncbi:hypothetical protein ACJIZ3_013498 [Penstemon smallii]|uniref:SAM-dependent MTase DRM-type domain-containing protein n=1 Tax=Penstemon smallii TaxID=265156 RepID=A0ABD3RH26_9LAMI
MCEVVDISDDEDSFVSENDVGVIPKDEGLDYDSGHRTENAGSSSGTNLRSSFIAMGFPPSDVDKAIAENGEDNAELLLETLSAYSAFQAPKTELFDDDLFGDNNDDLAATNLHTREAPNKAESSDSLDSLLGGNGIKNAYGGRDFPLKEEPDVSDGVSDEKISSLLKMNFSLDEVGFALDRLGEDASIGQLMDVIFAARMTKKYEKDAEHQISGDEENKKDCNNEALFGIMEKTLRLLEMGFSEQEISTAFESCGSEVPLPELADSIVAAQLGETGPNVVKHSSISGRSSAQSSGRHLNWKMENCSSNEPFDYFTVKTEECSSAPVPQDGISDLLEKLKGKRPKVEYADELNNWKKPKVEFEEHSSQFVGRMRLEATGRRNSTSTSNRVPATQRQLERLLSLEEDRKPTMSFTPSKSVTSMSIKPPYFLYGNVTDLSHDSWAKVSHFLISSPEFVNAKLYSALSRREGYVHNLSTEDRSHVSPKGPMTISEALPHTRKWWPSWDTRKQFSCVNCETSGISHLCDSLGRMLSESKGILSSEQQRKVFQQCDSLNLVWVGRYKLAPIDIEYVERIMGYPSNHTRVAGFSLSERLQSLKLSFQTDTLAYHLSVLKKHALSHGGLTVLSLFTGIGGVEIALHRLGIRLKGVLSVEPCEKKRKILKNWWENTRQTGELIQIESIHKVSGKKVENLIKKFSGIDLVVCQNPYTGATVGDSNSDMGLDFSLFVEFVRVLQCVRNVMKRK